jgi:hypothetical protein
MLSAKQDGNRAEPTAPRISSPSGGAVGKVVNSIQGLQQRLNDYSLEEIAAAENRSRTLLLGLLNLQSRVESLRAIKRSMTVVYETLEKATSEDIKLNAPDTSGKPLHLHDIIQASNLIKFPGLKRTSHQNAENAVPNAPSAGQIIPGANQTPNTTRAVIEACSGAERCEATDAPNEPAFVFEATEIEAAPGIPSADFSWGKDANPEENIIDDVQYEAKIQPTGVRPAAGKINQPHPNISAPEFVPETPLVEDSNAPISTALVPTGGDFDQRLLDDLIRNYGEFFSSSDSPSKIVSQSNTETAEVGSKTTFPEKAAVERATDNTVRTLPLKKEGDIDRELKKIIKDYGEYDIYSRQNRVNLKFAAIGAFLLLIAVSSGFYLLSSSKSHESPSPPAAIQPVLTTADDSTSGNRELKRPAQANEAKTSTSSPPKKN